MKIFIMEKIVPLKISKQLAINIVTIDLQSMINLSHHEFGDLELIVFSLSAHLPSQSNLVAVHEIMKQQLEFTRQFCESQKYLYHSLVEALTPDYVYTTLEETKKVRIRLQVFGIIRLP